MGFIFSIGSLLIFGADNFIIPAMVGMLVALTVLRKPIEKAGGFL